MIIIQTLWKYSDACLDDFTVLLFDVHSDYRKTN